MTDELRRNLEVVALEDPGRPSVSLALRLLEMERLLAELAQTTVALALAEEQAA